MKQLVILSGKGGTGKTSVTAAFAHLASTDGSPVRVVLVDADVDASNLDLVLNPTVLETHRFVAGQLAIISPELCEGHGTCAQVCRFDAVLGFGERETLSPPPHLHAPGIPTIDPIACEGCGACVYQCPNQAIHLEAQLAGHWFRSTSPYGPLFHAALRPAQENSGKLVAMVKQQARLLALEDGYDLVMVDGPPGIGCPVISAAAGADLALIVTEPSIAGVHDLERALGTTQHFGVASLVSINKADLHPEGTAAIEALCQERGVEVVGHIPYDTTVTQAMVRGMPVTAYSDSGVAQELRSIWARVLAALRSGG